MNFSHNAWLEEKFFWHKTLWGWKKRESAQPRSQWVGLLMTAVYNTSAEVIIHLLLVDAFSSKLKLAILSEISAIVNFKDLLRISREV